MYQTPQRARQATPAGRVARFAVPVLLLGLGTTGLVTASSGTSALEAVPAPVAAVATPVAPTAERTRSTSRSEALRPELTAESAAKASARAKAAEAAKSRAAAKVSADAKKAQAAKAAKANAKARAEAKATAKAKAAAAERAADRARDAARARAARARAAAAPALKVVDRKYTRVALNVRSAPDSDARLLSVLKPGARVSTTATVRDGWRYVRHEGRGAWVKNSYLAEKKPAARSTRSTRSTRSSGSTAGGVSSRPCRGGSGVESGLTRDAVAVHRAICARFPRITSFGGIRADGQSYHSSGRAVDAMVSDRDYGWQVARWLRANAKRLGVSEILFAQKIWTVQRGSEGWRSMSDRGSVSANHYDHVHVSVYGNAGR